MVLSPNKAESVCHRFGAKVEPRHTLQIGVLPGPGAEPALASPGEHWVAETDGFEPSIRVFAQMLP